MRRAGLASLALLLIAPVSGSAAPGEHVLRTPEDRNLQKHVAPSSSWNRARSVAEGVSRYSALLVSILAAALAPAVGLDRDMAVARARKALAEREQLEPARLEMVSAVEQTWPDASLGCPRKDALYAQAHSRGCRVVLGSGAARYDVRVGPRNAFTG